MWLIADGSKEVEKQVRAAIKTALTPATLATSDRSKPHKCQLNHCNLNGVINQLMVPFGKVAENTSSAATTVSDDITVWKSGCLCAVWPRAELDVEYNMTIMAEPEVHESAAKGILDGEYPLLNLRHASQTRDIAFSQF